MSTMWNLKDLVEYANNGGVQSSNGKDGYVPARPASGAFRFEKLKAAWEVFRGRADAVKWPQGQ